MSHVKMSRRLAACFLTISAAKCGQAQPPEPSTPVALARCNDPMPPPLAVVSRSGDPANCLTEAIKQRGLVVTMRVGRDGRASSLQEWAYLCASVDLKGRQLPPAELSASERTCMTNTLSAWRFAAFDTCAQQYAHIGFPAQGPQVGCAARVNAFGIIQPSR